MLLNENPHFGFIEDTSLMSFIAVLTSHIKSRHNALNVFMSSTILLQSTGSDQSFLQMAAHKLSVLVLFL